MCAATVLSSLSLSHVMRQQGTKLERNKSSKIYRRTDSRADSVRLGRVVKVGGAFLWRERPGSK